MAADPNLTTGDVLTRSLAESISLRYPGRFDDRQVEAIRRALEPVVNQLSVLRLYRLTNADEDATAVKRLRDAGAILVAKLGMVELAGGMGYEQPNASITGPGINPWNTDAWAGGSSSGSGSAVGGRLVPFALGSETWGSIVVPASYCGVSGLRPTYGRVSRHGAMALSWTLDKIGPLCRTADDCGLVLAAIAGADPADPTTLSTPYAYRTEGRVDGFRIGIVREGLDQMQPEVRANFQTALTVLSDVATFDEVTLPEFPYSEVATLVLRAEAAAAMEELAERNDFARLTAPEDRTSAYVGAAIPAVDYLRAQRIRRHAGLALDATFARYDAIVAPSTGLVASPLSARFDDYAGNLRRLVFGAAGNIAGLPSISVPNGFGERGLPTGIQFVGRATSENTILAVARAYQARSTWHRHLPILASAS